MRLDQVADELQVSSSKMSRVETGHTIPKVWDVRALVSVYGLEGGPTGMRLIEWAELLRADSWWRSVSDSVVPPLEYIVSLEAESMLVRAYCLPAFHGLLQTEPYARAVISESYREMENSDNHANTETIDGLVEVRMKRQELLTRTDDPLRLHVIVDESCLRRVVGSADVMSEQLATLLERSQLPNVSFQVYPFERGFHRAIAGSFEIFTPRLKDLDPDVAVVEQPFEEAAFEENKVGKYVEGFDSLSRKALDPAASRNMVIKILEG